MLMIGQVFPDGFIYHTIQKMLQRILEHVFKNYLLAIVEPKVRGKKWRNVDHFKSLCFAFWILLGLSFQQPHPKQNYSLPNQLKSTGLEERRSDCTQNLLLRDLLLLKWRFLFAGVYLFFLNFRSVKRKKRKDPADFVPPLQLSVMDSLNEFHFVQSQQFLLNNFMGWLRRAASSRLSVWNWISKDKWQ